MTAATVTATTAATAPAPIEGISFGRSMSNALTLARRNIIKIRKNPETLLDVTLQPIIFLVMFLYLFGGAIAGGTDAYLQVLLPGLMVQNVVFASMGTGVALCTDISKGVFDRFRSMPIGRSSPLVGAVLGDIVRYLVALGVLIGFAMILGFRVHTDPGSFLIAVALLLVFALLLCWVSVFVGLLVKSPQAVPGTLMIFMFALTFGSNVFAPTATMPGWLQAWVKINPITHLTDAARGLLLGGPWADHAAYGLLWGIGIAAVFFPLAMRTYRRRLG